jgi:hypothetical protein
MTANPEKPEKKPVNKPKSQKTSNKTPIPIKKPSTTKNTQKKTTTKPKKEVAPVVKDFDVHEEFPHSEFPYKLIHNEDDKKITSYFMNENHLNKHIERYHLDKRTIKVLYRYDYEEKK